MFTEIKDQVKGRLELVELSDFCPANFYQIDHIFMFEQLQNSYFS